MVVLEEKLSRLKSLVEKGKDQEAYTLFESYYFEEPLVSDTGDDTKLAEICNPIGFGILHNSEDWQREADWWKAVIETQEKYDKQKSVCLHKGLSNHNIALPLLELNLPEMATEYIQKAINEDRRNFGKDETKKRPAYKLGCFLIPIVKSRKWRDRDSSLPVEERNLLIDAFEKMFSQTASLSQTPSGDGSLSSIRDNDLREVLVKRYESIEKNIEEDSVIVAIYTGSIVEGLLTILLKDNPGEVVQSFRDHAGQCPNFIYFRHNGGCSEMAGVIDEIAPGDGSEDEKRKAIDLWSFSQKIKVAQRTGLFGESDKTALFILCHLLRGYRNIVHPTNRDTLGSSTEWEVGFKMEPPIARMLKEGLDIVLSTLSPHQDEDLHVATGKLDLELEQGIPTTASGVDSYPARRSLASPGMPGTFDKKGVFVPHNVQTTINTSSSKNISSPAMGSVTTPATLPSKGEGKDEV